MTELPFARQSAGSARHIEFSGERLLNCYVRPFPDRGVGPFITAFSPGLEPVATLAGPVRAVMEQGGAVYACAGGRLWRYAAGVVTELGVIRDDPDTTMAGNGAQVAVAAGGEYYVWSGGAVVAPATGAFEAVGSVAAVDSYVLLFERGGQRFSVTGLLQAGSVNALDFASAESIPDQIVRGHVDHSEVWIFGTRSIEIWVNTGAADFPFQRLSGGKLDRGCAFGGSVASEDNSVFWVGDDRVVYRANGYQPLRVSTQWVESILDALPADADVRAATFTQDGSKVYALILPDRPALLYDIATGVWHERGTATGRWLATCACRADGVILGGTDGRLHRFGGVTDGGQMIVREGVSLTVSAGREQMTVNSVQLHFQTSVTPSSVMLQVSRDGIVWGPERWKALGRGYDQLVRWFGWGRGRQFRWRFRITDPVVGALYGATFEASR